MPFIHYIRRASIYSWTETITENTLHTILDTKKKDSCTEKHILAIWKRKFQTITSLKNITLYYCFLSQYIVHITFDLFFEFCLSIVGLLQSKIILDTSITQNHWDSRELEVSRNERWHFVESILVSLQFHYAFSFLFISKYHVSSSVCFSRIFSPFKVIEEFTWNWIQTTLFTL